MATGSVLEACGLSKSFPGVRALQGVTFEIFPGEVHALVGENGAGKSTLLKTLFGAHQPDAGEIRSNGAVVRLNGPSEAIELGVAMVHQELSLVPQLNAIHNIVLGRNRTRFGIVDWRAARREALEPLRMLGFRASPDVPVSRLSLAQQQIVELARALTTRAKIIILDEPTASLTTQESAQLFNVIRRLRDAGCAVVYVSHRLAEVLELADRVTVLRDGRTVTSRPRVEIRDEDELVRLMVGRNLDALGVAGETAAGEEVLRIEHFTLPGVVHDVSLTVRRGEVVGLAGMVGAGRTELARAVIGAEIGAKGTVYLRGEKVRIRRPADAIRHGIAYLPEDRKSQGLALHMSIASNVTLLDPPGRWGRLDRRRQREIARKALEPLNNRTSVVRKVKVLSGGNQQKVVLARWLLTNSDVLIFDEPARGIDVGAKVEIHRLMRDLADQGKAILMISSDLTEILHMSDRILVMRRGRLVAGLDRADATEERVVAHAAGEWESP